MRGAAAAGWSYISLSGMNAPRAASFVGSLPSQTRVALATLMQRANAPQPYPYYHSQQPRSPSPMRTPVNNNNPIENNIPLTMTTENGCEIATTAANVVILSEPIAPSQSAAPVNAVPPQLEKVPLVQRWRPSRGSRYSQRIGKSISLDTPVSIAHV